jgi:hypothetical protein
MVCFVLQTADSSFPLVVGCLFCGVEGADKSCTTHIFCAPSLDRSNGVGQSDCGHCSSVKICQSYMLVTNRRRTIAWEHRTHPWSIYDPRLALACSNESESPMSSNLIGSNLSLLVHWHRTPLFCVKFLKK